MAIGWNGGIYLEYDSARLIFDPQRKHNSCDRAFITHAHHDHSKGFGFKETQKFSTKETKQIAETYWKRIDSWQQLQLGEGTEVDSVEILCHNAGHVLGSAMFEVRTREGNILYTGDLQFKDSLTLKGAEPVECDVLIIESTFGSSSFKFPERETVAQEMIRWAEKTIRKKKVPVFKADALGNAQEITRAFNMYSDLPVTVHQRVDLINRLYNANGQHLEYVDSNPEETADVISAGECIFIAPKNANLPYSSRFEQALVSGWALWTKSGKTAFPLSDHADFDQLIEFVAACKPKTALTCFGGRFDSDLARQIHRHLGIEARPLNLISTRFMVET
ncbi:MAG: hypothetical protein ACUVUE_04300 [Candidatus Bathycorpusculaceae bacterium]